MLNLYYASVLMILLASVFAPIAEDEPGTPSDTKAVAQSNTSFALELYAKLAKKEGNLFFSPYSISTALAMAYAGARGETAEQMSKTLHFTLGQEQLHSAFAGLIREVQSSTGEQGIQLHVANALWGQKGYPFLDTFLDLVKRNYSAGLREVDFAIDPDSARLTINRWVEEQTRDKIKDLIQPGVLTPMSRLVLTNAIYFKGAWQSQFREKATQPGDFFMTPDKSVKVPMMQQTESARYHESDKFQLLELAYRGHTQSLLICLPKKGLSLAALESELSLKNLDEWLARAKGRQVKIYIPKFKITQALDLNKTLEAMGMLAAFSATDADFSGIDGRRDLYLSKVVHNAFVDVNEQGTEAAAATAAVVGVKSAPPDGAPVEFRADRPFLFWIRDAKTGSILFMGRLVNPAS
jgi:serpin B